MLTTIAVIILGVALLMVAIDIKKHEKRIAELEKRNREDDPKTRSSL